MIKTLVIIFALVSTLAYANEAVLLENWYGYNYTRTSVLPTGNVMIMAGEEVMVGGYIEILDINTGTFSNVTILTINDNMIEVYNHVTNTHQSLLMDE